MKANEQPQFDKKWWVSGRPSEISGSDLEKALQNAQKALAEEQKKKDPRAISNCISAIQAVGAAATKTVKRECDKKKHKDVITVLGRFDNLVRDEVRRLEEALKAAQSGDEPDDDEEPDDNGLFDVKYLKKCIKQVRRRELSFACGVHSKGEQSRIIFSKKKPPKYLFRVIKGNRELGLPTNRLTFGMAYPDSEEATTMVLNLDDEAKQPMAIIKKMRKLFKKQKDKYRPFKQVKVIFRGRIVEDIPDPEDTEPEEDDEDEGTMEAYDEPMVASEPGEEGESVTAASEAPPQAAASATATSTATSQAPEASAATATVEPPQEARPAPEAGTQAAGEAAASAAAATATQAAPGQEELQQEEEERQSRANHRKLFKEARKTWVATREKAIQDLEMVKDGIRDYYLDDREQYQVATQKMQELDEIMDNLSHDLRDTFDSYVSTPLNQQAKLAQQAEQARQLLDNFLRYVDSSPLMSAIDQKEFADVQIQGPMRAALRRLADILSE